MDPPVSDDEDDDSMYSSSLITSNRHPLGNQADVANNDNNNNNNNDNNNNSTLSQSIDDNNNANNKKDADKENNETEVAPNDIAIEAHILSSTDLAKIDPIPSQPHDVSSSTENDKINDEDIKVKIPLSTSIMLTKLDNNTNDVIKKLSEPRLDKVTIKFQPIGSIEQIQPKIFKISSSQQFQTLVRFLNKKLAKRITNKTTNKLFGGCIFCYLHNSFTPGPEEIIGNLFEHFAINNELTVSYCDTVAFR